MPRHERFEHTAVVHHGAAQLGEALAPELDEAISGGDAVLLCLPQEGVDAITHRLSRPGAPTCVTPDVRYARPGVAMSTLHRFVTEAMEAGAPRVWSIGTIPFAGDPSDRRWLRYEQAADEVLGHLPLRAVCTYDTAVLDPALVDSAQHTHVTTTRLAETPPSGGAPSTGRRRRLRADEAVLTADDPSAGDVRRQLRAAFARRLPVERMGEIELVATELVVNSARHARGPVTVAAWDVGRSISLEVGDGGGGITDPYADLRPLDGGSHGGFGLWLVGQLADEVAIERRDDRTVVTTTFHIGRDTRSALPPSG